jgi:hypothetical protein
VSSRDGVKIENMNFPPSNGTQSSPAPFLRARQPESSFLSTGRESAAIGDVEHNFGAPAIAETVVSVDTRSPRSESGGDDAPRTPLLKERAKQSQGRGTIAERIESEGRKRLLDILSSTAAAKERMTGKYDDIRKPDEVNLHFFNIHTMILIYDSPLDTLTRSWYSPLKRLRFLRSH